MISLTELLTKDSFDIQLDQEGMDISLQKRENGLFIIVPNTEIRLSYDQSRWESNAESYLAEQLKFHRAYYTAVKEVLLPEFSASVSRSLEKESDISRLLQFVPERAQPQFMKIMGWLVAPLYWITGRTMQGAFRGYIAESQKLVDAYALTGEVMNYGKDFFNDFFANRKEKLSKPAQSQELLETMTELSYAYSRLLDLSQKRLAFDQRHYQLFFPH